MCLSFSRMLFLVVLLISESTRAIANTNVIPMKDGPYTSYAPVLTVVGYTDERQPILLVSTDGGHEWVSSFIAGSPNSGGAFYGTSCTVNGHDAICIATGQENRRGFVPMLAVSTNGGYTWATKKLAYRALISGASCTGSGPTAICTAVLSELKGYQPSKPAKILISQDGGNTWLTKAIENLPKSVSLGAGNSCTGNESEAICAAIGYDAHDKPSIVVGSNGGKTWLIKRVPGLLVGDILKDVSCTGNGVGATCIAIGERPIASSQPNNKRSAPFIVGSTNGGQTWEIKSVPDPLKNSKLLAVNCTGNGNNALCAAIGFTPKKTYIIASTDNGKTWEEKYHSHGFLNSVSCTGHGVDAMCAAEGNLPNLHVVVVSTDRGRTWSEKHIEHLPNESIANSISCTGAGTNALCMFVGNNFIVLSGDGGSSWARPQSMINLKLPPARLARSAASD